MQAFKRTMSHRSSSSPSSPTLSTSSSSGGPGRADRSVTPEEMSEQISSTHHKIPNSRRSLQEPSAPNSPLAVSSVMNSPRPNADTDDGRPSSPLPAPSEASESFQDATSDSPTKSDFAASETTSAASSGAKGLVVPSTLHLSVNDVQTSEKALLEDLESVSRVLDLFLNSRITEAQDMCFEPAKQGSLYMSHGFSCISTIKALLTFEHQDLAYAIECCQSTMHLCNLLRKPTGVTSAVGNWMRGISAADQVKGMSIVQRHAELVYAECIILKAFAAIMRSGDFFTFIREALSLRSAHSSYRALGRYLETERQAMDPDFASGVHLGLGAVSLVLSLLPEKAVSVMSYFGFEGDRQTAVNLLKSPGGWAGTEPIERAKQGLRRPLADMVLLAYLLYIASLVPVGPIDTKLATRILEFSKDIYPNGAFLWLFYGRLKTLETQDEKAVENYWRSINSQSEAVQLHHMCHWDLSIIHLATGDLKAAQESLEKIYKSSNWSKAVYSFGVGAAAYERACDIESQELKDTATEYLRQVPSSKQKIAGKSIPMEKYVARRAQRYVQQDNQLLLTALEFTFMLNALQYAPSQVLKEVHLKRIDAALVRVEAASEEERETWNGNGTWWDDYLMCKLLSGACNKLLAYPPSHVRIERTQDFIDSHSARAREDLNTVLSNGRKIKLEHQMVWFGHYEMAALCESLGDIDEAVRHYKIILNPKPMQVSSSSGKVNLQQAVVIRANAALNLLEEAGKAKNT